MLLLLLPVLCELCVPRLLALRSCSRFCFSTRDSALSPWASRCLLCVSVA